MNRDFTLRILSVVRQNPFYTNRMTEAQKLMGTLIADAVVKGEPVSPQALYAYKYFQERGPYANA